MYVYINIYLYMCIRTRIYTYIRICIPPSSKVFLFYQLSQNPTFYVLAVFFVRCDVFSRVFVC